MQQAFAVLDNSAASHAFEEFGCKADEKKEKEIRWNEYQHRGITAHRNRAYFSFSCFVLFETTEIKKNRLCLIRLTSTDSSSSPIFIIVTYAIDSADSVDAAVGKQNTYIFIKR